jgi:flagellar hook-associated protein FlgK
MKRIAGVLTIVAASAFLSAATLLGAEKNFGMGGQKDQCLLVAAYCADNVDSINQRIERLNKEIAKGTDVYTPEELNKLRDKLDDAVKTLNDLIKS